MKRLQIRKRDKWWEKCESVGMNYHTMESAIYWDESVCYEFTSQEVDKLEAASDELHEMCISAAEHVIKKDRFSDLKIPGDFRDLIIKSWNEDEPSMYGRFDFCYDGTGEPKLLEYNADTPTSLLEASVVQWYWLRDVYPDCDQFNSIHEKLIEFWKERSYNDLVHFACLHDTEEDFGNLEYVRDTAIQGGFETRQVFIEDIGWAGNEKRFVDLDNEPITVLFKLYPWEWMFTDQFGPNISQAGISIIEPAWKSLLSNKGILAVLWELYPDHQNLLPAYFTNRFNDNYVQKPFLSREGDSVIIHKNGAVTGAPGTYGAEGHIFQQYAPMPQFSGNFVSLGSWIINGKSAGIGIREDINEITSNTSRFIPHFFM